MVAAPSSFIRLANSMARPLGIASENGPTKGANRMKATTKTSCSRGICHSGACCDFNNAIAANSRALSASADRNCEASTETMPRENRRPFGSAVEVIPDSFRKIGVHRYARGTQVSAGSASGCLRHLLQRYVSGLAGTQERQGGHAHNLAGDGEFRAAKLPGSGEQSVPTEVGVGGELDDAFAALGIRLRGGGELCGRGGAVGDLFHHFQ